MHSFHVNKALYLDCKIHDPWVWGLGLSGRATSKILKIIKILNISFFCTYTVVGDNKN